MMRFKNSRYGRSSTRFRSPSINHRDTVNGDDDSGVCPCLLFCSAAVAFMGIQKVRRWSRESLWGITTTGRRGMGEGGGGAIGWALGIWRREEEGRRHHESVQ